MTCAAARAGRGARLGIALLVLLFAGCGEQAVPEMEGEPPGPYRLSLALQPPHPSPGAETTLRFMLTRASDGAPVTDLAVVHERLLHTFIVAEDFSSFAHLHHEDFTPLTADDRARATLHFPYRFPAAGRYRIVSEFVHRDRSWSKHFELRIGATTAVRAPRVDLSRAREIDGYQARLATSPARPVAGHEAEFVLSLSRGGLPVTDLALLLGAEVHVAAWRIDGEHFGHTHSYTRTMAEAMAAMAGHRMDGAHSAAMMLELMSAPARLEYPGPRVPFRHVFPAPGIYQLFVQCAPGGKELVLPFMVEVLADDGRQDTTLESMVPVATGS